MSGGETYGNGRRNARGRSETKSTGNESVLGGNRRSVARAGHAFVVPGLLLPIPDRAALVVNLLGVPVFQAHPRIAARLPGRSLVGAGDRPRHGHQDGGTGDRGEE